MRIRLASSGAESILPGEMTPGVATSTATAPDPPRDKAGLTYSRIQGTSGLHRRPSVCHESDGLKSTHGTYFIVCGSVVSSKALKSDQSAGGRNQKKTMRTPGPIPLTITIITLRGHPPGELKRQTYGTPSHVAPCVPRDVHCVTRYVREIVLSPSRGDCRRLSFSLSAVFLSRWSVTFRDPVAQPTFCCCLLCFNAGFDRENSHTRTNQNQTNEPSLQSYRAGI